MNNKKIIFIINKSPHSGLYGQECLDIILMCAAFENKTSILLLDEAIFYLKKTQNSFFLSKDMNTLFSSLELYDIGTIFIEKESLQKYGLSERDLGLSTQVYLQQDIPNLLKQFDIIIAH